MDMELVYCGICAPFLIQFEDKVWNNFKAIAIE